MNNIILSLGIIYFYIQVLFHLLGLYAFIKIIIYIKNKKND